jgi:hypothetical protein
MAQRHAQRGRMLINLKPREAASASEVIAA